MTITLETTASLSAVSNNILAEAFAELAGLITSRAHLPAVYHGSFSVIGARPDIDLWFDEAEHVTAWAESFDAEVTTRTYDEAGEAHTITRAAVPDRFSARLRLVHLRYHDRPASV